MIEGSCHCGSVRWTVESLPASIRSCNCSLCRRFGALWVYVSPTIVKTSGETTAYAWGPRTVAFQHCTQCGCLTHWTSTDPARDLMGLNVRMAAPEAYAGIPIKDFDGASR